MRQIATLSTNDQAEFFANHLRGLQIPCTVRSGPDGEGIWVHEDDQIALAKHEFDVYLTNPNHQRYRDASQRAMAQFRQDLAQRNAGRQRTVNLREKWDRPIYSSCPVTVAMSAIAIATAIFVGFMTQRENPLLDRLFFSTGNTLAPLMRGEIWRLVTPIFLHGDPLHLILNLVMLFQLGAILEMRLGSLKYLVMVLTIAVISNFAEFLFSTPWFGGLSGVNYGLFGYCWIRGVIDDKFGLRLTQSTVMTFLVWTAMCMFGVVGNIANWVHGAGLLTGAAMAYFGFIMKPYLRHR